MTEHEHDWLVFSTALATGAILVYCEMCEASGTIDDPTSEEWSQAFYAPNDPYRWRDNSRVNVWKGEE